MGQVKFGIGSPDLSLLASTSKKKQQLEFKIDGGKKQH